jgi:hypothetical protein
MTVGYSTTIESWNATLMHLQHPTSASQEKEEHVQEAHEPRHEAVAGPGEDPEEAGEERRADGRSDRPALERVCDEEPRRGLVEAVLLLEDERLVPFERKRGNGGAKVENAHERDRLQRLFFRVSG